MGPGFRFIASCACAALLCAPVARAQRASVVVAPIPDILAGNVVSVRWSVTNTGREPRSFGVGAEIRRGGVLLADLGTRSTPKLAPGASAHGSFVHRLPTWWSGDVHVARAAVWSAAPCSSQWLGSGERMFTVEPLRPAMTGLIAYHTYREYLARPADADDGHIFIWHLPAGPLRNLTAGLAVENALNPRFSPDGSHVIFTALPSGVVPPDAPRDYESIGSHLELYAYDLARGTLTRLTHNDVADEDAEYSPDGQRIVFKRAGQVWMMTADGSAASAITSPGPEQSGPRFSPDGSSIVYWQGDGARADVWRMALDGSRTAPLASATGLQEYYPVYRDAQTVLYSRWESASDRHDDLYAHSLSSGATQRLSLGLVGVEDADPFAIDASFVGFSSTRRGESYDLYVGSPASGDAYPVGTASPALQELGGTYSPHAHARALELVSPGASVERAGGRVLDVTIAAYSDGAAWTGASPRIVLEGPARLEYANLRDDGTGADLAANDGLYSATLLLPVTPGTYRAHAAATSDDETARQEIRSASALWTVTGVTAAQPSEPIGSLAFGPTRDNSNPPAGPDVREIQRGPRTLRSVASRVAPTTPRGGW